MENQEERAARKSNKAVLVAVVVLIIAGGAFAAFKAGLIPGLGGGKVASELKAEIEAARGGNVKNKIVELYQKNPTINPEMKAEIVKAINESLDMTFDYADLKTSSGEGKGTVEIISPKLTIKPPAGKAQPGDSPIIIEAPKAIVSRDVNDDSHYFFHTEGDITMSGDVAKTGTVSKIFSISGDAPYNEFRTSKDMRSGYIKSSVKNLKFIEGRGNTIVATIGEASIEADSKITGDKMNGWAKVSYKNIIPGDMIKLMVGAIDPITFNLDYAYNGDDYTKQVNELMDNSQKQQEERAKAAKDPSYVAKPVPKPEIKPFDGHLQIHDFSLLMGDAGIVANLDMTFKKDNPKLIPSGQALLKIQQYQKLITYFSKFFPIPQDKIQKSIDFASELGKNEAGNVTIEIKFDGTENVLIGGKTIAEVQALQAKYYPREASPYAPQLPSDGAPKPAPAAPVSGKPIIENQTKI